MAASRRQAWPPHDSQGVPMPDQNRSPDGIPRKDADRPSPDVERYATDGQSDARGKGASDEQGEVPPRTGEQRGQAYQGDGPGKVGLTSDRQPGLVAPGGVNDRGGGATGDNPIAAEAVNFDD